MRFGQPHMQGHDAGLGAKAKNRQQKRHRGPERRQGLLPHVGETVVAGVGLQHAKAQQDGDGAKARHRDVKVASAAHLGDAVVGGDQEVRGQRHGLPHHHEGIGVVGQHHARHAGQEHVVFQAHQAGRCAFTLAEVAGGKDGYAGRGSTDQHQEIGCQTVQPQVEVQARQADRKNRDFGRIQQGAQRQNEQPQPEQAAQREQHAGHQGKAAQGEQAGGGDQQPAQHHHDQPIQA